MSILIKGMKMPSCCLVCPCSGTPDTNDGNEVWVCEASKLHPLTIEDKVERRPKWCPLVPIPSHGRLIDEEWLKDAMITTLEALKKNPKMDRQEMHLIAAFDTLRVMIEDAPTIIEADL